MRREFLPDALASFGLVSFLFSCAPPSSSFCLLVASFSRHCFQFPSGWVCVPVGRSRNGDWIEWSPRARDPRSLSTPTSAMLLSIRPVSCRLEPSFGCDGPWLSARADSMVRSRRMRGCGRRGSRPPFRRLAAGEPSLHPGMNPPRSSSCCSCGQARYHRFWLVVAWWQTSSRSRNEQVQHREMRTRFRGGNDEQPSSRRLRCTTAADIHRCDIVSSFMALLDTVHRSKSSSRARASARSGRFDHAYKFVQSGHSCLYCYEASLLAHLHEFASRIAKYTPQLL